MSKISPSTPELNRLRAAAGLIPLIEDGLRDSKIDPERAALMAEFCLWAVSQKLEGEPEASRLIGDIERGLERIKTQLA